MQSAGVAARILRPPKFSISCNSSLKMLSPRPAPLKPRIQFLLLLLSFHIPFLFPPCLSFRDGLLLNSYQPVIYLPLEDSHCFVEPCPIYCFNLCCACFRPGTWQGLQMLPRCSKCHRSQMQRLFPGRLCGPWAEHVAQVFFFFFNLYY